MRRIYRVDGNAQEEAVDLRDRTPRTLGAYQMMMRLQTPHSTNSTNNQIIRQLENQTTRQLDMQKTRQTNDQTTRLLRPDTQPIQNHCSDLLPRELLSIPNQGISTLLVELEVRKMNYCQLSRSTTLLDRGKIELQLMRRPIVDPERSQTASRPANPVNQLFLISILRHSSVRTLRKQLVFICRRCLEIGLGQWGGSARRAMIDRSPNSASLTCT